LSPTEPLPVMEEMEMSLDMNNNNVGQVRCDVSIMRTQCKMNGPFLIPLVFITVRPVSRKAATLDRSHRDTTEPSTVTDLSWIITTFFSRAENFTGDFCLLIKKNASFLCLICA
jgi:hypothetical protein